MRSQECPAIYTVTLAVCTTQMYIRSKINTVKENNTVTITRINVTSVLVGFLEISPVKREFDTRSLYNERLTVYEVFWTCSSEDKL